MGDGRRRGRGTGAALSLAVMFALALAAQARAATPLEILQLRLQPCPAYDTARMGSYTDAQVEDAKAGDFIVDGRPAHLVPPVDWSQDPHDDRSWVHYFHGFPWLDRLLYGYVHGGDVAALAGARDLMLDWVANNPPPVGAREENWKDKTTGDRAGYLGFVARAAACESLLSDAQASTLIDSARQHAAVLSDPALYEVHNHGLFADFGLARLGTYLSFLPQASAWLDLARQRFRSTLAKRLIQSEGLWLEQSTSYQYTIISLAQRFGDRYGSVLPTSVFARMRDVAGWLVTPAGRTVPWGDSNSGEAPDWALSEAADDSGLLLLPGSGIAAVKDSGGYLLVTASFHNRTHKHADDLGFHLYDRGRDVVSDTGIFHYNLDKWRQFSAAAEAHSVLTVGRRGLPIDKDGRAYGSGIRAAGVGDGWYAIKGATPLLRPQGVRHKRLFLYRPGRALVVIDSLRAKGVHSYHRRFQIAPGIGHRRRRGRVQLEANGFAGSLRVTRPRSRLEIVEGHYSPPRGWSFPGRKRRVPRPTLEYTTRTKDAELVAALGLRGGIRAKLIRAGGKSLKLRVGGPAVRNTTLRVSRAGDRLQVQRVRPSHRRR
jgi:hypothetical protein